MLILNFNPVERRNRTLSVLQDLYDMTAIVVSVGLYIGSLWSCAQVFGQQIL